MPSWKHDDVFPIIARIIGDAYKSDGRFITHDEIAEGLLDDAQGAAIIKEAQRQKKLQSIEWFAHNMVAWFSQRITRGNTDWGDTFDRKMLRGKWAYKPKQKWVPNSKAGRVGRKKDSGS